MENPSRPKPSYNGVVDKLYCYTEARNRRKTIFLHSLLRRTCWM